jgi:hypothetical protein
MTKNTVDHATVEVMAAVMTEREHGSLLAYIAERRPEIFDQVVAEWWPAGAPGLADRMRDLMEVLDAMDGQDQDGEALACT